MLPRALQVASTWEGVRAVESLQKQHNIACNCTLLFRRVLVCIFLFACGLSNDGD
jgi:transaldolase